MHGAMLCPIIAGVDKTTVSVATGQTDYHLVYMSCGNLTNDARRAHREGVIPVAFLAIPQGNLMSYIQRNVQQLTNSPVGLCEFENDDKFCLFRKQLYHASLTKIFKPLRSGMTTPEIMLCPDGRYQKVVFELGPFIADYPEQVMLAGIVQGWCPKLVIDFVTWLSYY
jgi:hypothetical protein